MKVEKEYYIGYRDVDPNEYLSNTSLLAFLENTAGLHSQKADDDINPKTTWFLIGWKVKLIERPKYGETIKVVTWAREFKKIESYREFEIKNEDGILLGIALSKWVYIDVETGKLQRIEKEVYDKYEPENITNFKEEDKYLPKLQEVEIQSEGVKFKVTKSMIDVNRHMHNIYINDAAMECLPNEIAFSGNLNEFDILYKKQSMSGDILISKFKEDLNKVTVNILNDKDEVVAICEYKKG